MAVKECAADATPREKADFVKEAGAPRAGWDWVFSKGVVMLGSLRPGSPLQAELMKRLKHPNVIRLLGVCMQVPRPAGVCPSTTLAPP